jgi:hypothetical protein
MGFLRDALNLGYITLDQYDDMSEEWSELGYRARDMGDTEAFQKMMEDFLDLGFLDLADAVFTEYNASISFYEELYGYSIYYDIGVSRWRDVSSGKFVIDPYETIREE